MKANLTFFLLASVLVFTFSACSPKNTEPQGGTTVEIIGSSAGGASSTPLPSINADRLGNPITVPESIDKIISMGPSNTEILIGLGLGDKIIAVDTYSEDIDGFRDDVAYFSMLDPDAENMVDLQPDVIFITEMSMAGGDDPLKPVRDTGICVIYIPSSNSIEGIMEDIKFIADVTGTSAQGQKIVADMNAQIDNIKALCSQIPADSAKSVYFEIEAAPYMYSFGRGVFLNEMIEIAGGNNIFKDQESWIAVADETILAADPDVIFTCVSYLDDPINELKSRPGWSALNAVQNGNIYFIDTNSSNRPSQYIVKALEEMAKALYPEIYDEN